MKKEIKKNYHNFLRTVYVVINYSRLKPRTSRVQMCRRILKNELGSLTPKQATIWKKFCILTGYKND